MNSFDYIEVNAICIMVLSILLFGMPSRHQAEMTGKLYCKLLFTAIIVCLSDMIAGLCRGQMFSGARAALWISNILFFVSSLAESYIWLLYSAQVLNGMISVHYKRALGVTFAVISILYITAPLHGLTFFIDDQNCYHRGPLIWTHWLTLLVSMALPSLKALFSSTEKKRKKAIALFALLPFLCTVLQVAFYGYTVAQAGLTGSLLLLYMLLQSEEVNAALLRAQISEELSNTDALTKLNNRRSYDIRL